ncbi:hypothetical protein MJO28_012862 [Puccinia striiformis f. sp. tritici]|uniref:Calcineurin-like phosphoesterase domain-containing protein n=3 Tax=Puccinia striiformis TaxID=27350 RepID=A0A0L0VMI1_9BASI|nr:hypothetical protein Pst134EA_024647 [Puccinia striiformis f. sp. tritici]KNF00432.1 hypothetical protein PSTG_06359 [Puccinia striiformis f. sp. tritici PST-78]POW16974.1 hypothetical protein PSTT_00890 [Puccinia striiformis]KAH9453782.1 hypothetical protein Pst134EA_024647 [Puccinia striiformis f. sp. tritici]KAI7940577.1 hypothetical protein MJO28_012862 [Puccinia striiformis f. sp. tritici]KAI7943364.1 hypothetical protein MJO29_013208 [Puccinia striiformis f. sp. tritici]
MYRSAAAKHDHAAFDMPSSRPLTSPKLHTRHKRSRSRSRLPPALYDILYVYPASFRTLLFLLIVGGILFWLSTHLFVFARFMFVDTVFSAGWFASHLALRKQPLLFVHSPWSAAIVWETTQPRSENSHKHKGIGLRYWKQVQTSTRASGFGLPKTNVQPHSIAPKVQVDHAEGQEGKNRWVHSVLLDHLESGTTYEYELVLESGNLDPLTGLPAIVRSYGNYQFKWLGVNQPDPASVEHLSSMVVTTNKTISPIELFIVGDTHSSPGTLRPLIKKSHNLKSYLPPRGSLLGVRNITKSPPPTQPHLMIHMGNAVHEARDLKQWQTEFWDPITFQQKASSEIPIIYSRGAHDFDVKGKSIYTAGLSHVQVGEINRTRVALLKNQKNRVILPGVSIAERQYGALLSAPRDHRTRGTFFAYSPHPRARVLVLDSNLAVDRQAFYKSRSSLTEVVDQEHWLLWEMARPEWKEASLRLIVVNQAPFVEHADEQMWKHDKDAQLNHYIRTVYAPHFHATSDVTRMYDIPPATLVISSNEVPAYSRGLLRTYFTPYFFEKGPSSNIPKSLIKQHELARYSDLDPHSHEEDHGVVYVVTPGSGKYHKNAPTKVENWGFYETSQSHLKQHKTRATSGGGADYFSPLTLDMAPEFETDEMWLEDSHENTARRQQWSDQNVRVYRIAGSQLPCPIKYSEGDHHIKQYTAIDRLYWRTMDVKGRLVDRFVIEATSCRQTN